MVREASDLGLVSVIVPVYRTSLEVVRRQIDSILAQTYKNLEVIVVDDGNEPSYRSGLEGLCRIDARIRLISQENGGVSKARNRGLDEAAGDFIAFADADDEVFPNFVAKGVAYLDGNDLDMVCGRCISRFSSKDIVKTLPVGKSCLVVSDTVDLERVARSFFAHEREKGSPMPLSFSCAVWGKLYRASLLGSCRFDERMDMCEDAVFNSDAVLEADRVGFVDDVWYVYYQNEGSIYHSLEFDERFSSHYAIASEHVGDRPGFHTALQVQFFHRFICTMNNVVGRCGFSAVADVRGGLRQPVSREVFSSIDPSCFDVGARWRVIKVLGGCRMAALLVLAFALKRGVHA